MQRQRALAEMANNDLHSESAATSWIIYLGKDALMPLMMQILPPYITNKYVITSKHSFSF